MSGCKCGEPEAINRYGHHSDCPIHMGYEMKDSEICPACGTEWENGTMKMCGNMEKLEVQKLREENARLRSVLEFYASESSWINIGEGDCIIEQSDVFHEQIISGDGLEIQDEWLQGGKRAIEALKGSSE